MQAVETACGRKRLELTLTPVTFGGKKLELGAETGFDIRYLGERHALYRRARDTLAISRWELELATKTRYARFLER